MILLVDPRTSLLEEVDVPHSLGWVGWGVPAFTGVDRNQVSLSLIMWKGGMLRDRDR